nr:metalloregulator ArsR/SmtB family transcription factor [Ktedonobacteraceae bacterium]
MPGDANIASIASMLADPTRVSILLALGNGRALPAGELARLSRVNASTASTHLAKLVEYGLLLVEKQGRHRYYRLADPAIEQVLESLALFAPASPVRSLRESEAGKAVRAARMCYGHLAGALGVALAQTLVDRQMLVDVDEGYIVTDDGQQWLYDFGIAGTLFKKREQLFVPHHIDWSERRHHVAGALGAALAMRLFDLEWIKHAPAGRAVHVTEGGRKALVEELGICLDR